MQGGGNFLKPPPKRLRVASRQGSKDARMQKASPKPRVGKTVSGSSGNVTPNRNPSRGKVRPGGNTGSVARLKSGGRVGSRQGTGAANNQQMSTGPTSTGLQSQSSGENQMVRTTMNAKKNSNMSLSLRA